MSKVLTEGDLDAKKKGVNWNTLFLLADWYSHALELFDGTFGY